MDVFAISITTQRQTYSVSVASRDCHARQPRDPEEGSSVSGDFEDYVLVVLNLSFLKLESLFLTLRTVKKVSWRDLFSS